MALVDDQVLLNTQDSGDESAWTVTHTGMNLNDVTSQIAIYREGGACADGQLDVTAGTFTDNVTSVAINNGIRDDKLYVIWLWMTTNITIDAATDILVGISDATSFGGDSGLWDMRPLFQAVDRGGWQPCAIYPTQPDQVGGTFANLNKAALLSQRVDIDNSSGSQVRLFGIEQSFLISYIGGHSVAVTLDALVGHSKDKTNHRDSGMINSLGAAYRTQVVFRLGDASATALTSFAETSKIVHFDNFNTDHEIGFDFINDTGGDELHFGLGDFLGNSPVGGVFMFWNDAVSASVTAGSFVSGDRYRILTVGNTDFVAIGAASDTVGVTFVATGVGSGTGTAEGLNNSDVFIGSANCDKFRIYAGTFLNAGPIELPPHVTSKGSVADLVTIGAGGTGYVVGDDLTATSGTGTKATFNVDAVSSGVVTAVTQLTEGDYTVDPTNPSATTSVPSAGRSGATLNITTRFFKECKGYIFDTCGEVDIGDLTFEDNKILNAASGVLYAGTGTRRSVNNQYIGCLDAIHFDTAQTVTLDGDTFSGNTTDIHFSGTGTLTVNLSNGANPTTSRVSGGGTVVINPPSVTIEVNVKDVDAANLQNARVFIETAATITSGEIFEAAVTTLTSSLGTATCTTTAVHGLTTGDKVVIRGAQPDDYNKVATVTVSSTTVFTYSVTSGITSPATGTPVVSFVPIHALTNVSGNVSLVAPWAAAQSLKGWARLKTASSPFYKEAAIAFVVNTTSGNSINTVLQPDE